MTSPAVKSEATGQRIRERRIALGFTLDHIAKLVGVTKSAVCQWEKGDPTNISADKFLKLSLELRCDPYELMGINGSSITTPNIEVSRLAQAIEFVDVMLPKHKINLTPILKAKLLLYLSEGNAASPSEMEVLRLVKLLM